MENNKKTTLLKNTVMLYILTFSGYFFSFITVPFQTRILGPEVYGEVGFAQAITVYVQLVLDFGFILCSTARVARNREDPMELSRIMTAVLYCKLALGLLSLGVIATLCLTVARFRTHMGLHLLFFLSTFLAALLPDFLYRGMEQMSAITYRTVGMRLFFTLCIFLFMRRRDQAYMLPLFNALGGLGACVWAYVDVRKRIGVRFVGVKWSYVWQTMKESAGYFLSRIASTVYSATNTLIAGVLYPAGATLGHYSSAEKLMTTARSAFSPIADSLYPYMVKNKDYKLVKKVLLVLMPLIVVGCTGVAIFAEPFCVLLFGEEFRGSAPLLQLLMPVVALSLPEYVMGFPVLTPLGLGKYANYSVIAGAVLHALQLAVLFLLGRLDVYTVCIATVITESFILLFRVAVVLIHNAKAKKAGENI